MAVGFGVLGLSARQFWAMTPREFEAALRGRFGDGTCLGALSQHDLSQLMQMFPD